VIPQYFKEIIEQIAFEARESDFVDQKSGVSARLTISAMEALVSNAERRAIVNDDNIIVPRVTDLAFVTQAVTGKVELVFEGEQEGMAKVAKALVGKAVKSIFKRYFPDPNLRERQKRDERASEKYDIRSERPAQSAQQKPSEYDELLRWFSQGNVIALRDTMPFNAYYDELARVPRLKELTARHMSIQEVNKFELASAMEFVLDALHQHSKIAKDESNESEISYKDMVGSIFRRPTAEDDEEDDN
jgi:magnesium chelatase subunit I